MGPDSGFISTKVSKAGHLYGDRLLFTFHDYDLTANGTSKLGSAYVEFLDGWPALAPVTPVPAIKDKNPGILTVVATLGGIRAARAKRRGLRLE